MGFEQPKEPKNFNSRPCERGDPFVIEERVAQRFQFTPLREGRRLKEMRVPIP